MKSSPRTVTIPFFALALAVVLGFAGVAAAAPQVGAPAPAFSGKTTDGGTIDLADLRGKTVVLEWTNHDCPYVRKHYGSGNMQALQKDATADGTVWLSIISSAPGRQGYVEPAEADELTEKRGASPSHVVLDPEGEIGRTYGARVTPHMYVIDPDGVLRYMGGIDDRPTTRPADVEGANNYVRAALAELKSGGQVSTPVARPYGCTIKYGS
ncbi:MAG: thioredoxin family protein [Gammaproteobacteria bacterium]|nr:thioredoxin family protein [Gammaproteobacteria bacterium]